MTAIEVAIIPGQAAGTFRVEVIRSPAGEAFAEIALDIEALLAKREQLQQVVLASTVATRAILPQTERPLREMGQVLFSALLGSGDVAGRYRASAAVAAERGQGLRIVLRVDDPALAGLPWEAMYDTVAGGYVCRRDQLVRRIPVSAAAAPLTVQPPLRILGIVSSPLGLPQLDVEKEQEQLARALAPARAAGLVEVHWAPEATWASLQDMLLGGQWHAVHFIGHGEFDVDRDEGVLALVGENGRADRVDADRLVDLLHEARPMPRLVLLNSCSGAATGVRDLFAGTAAALVRGGVSAVAAMQYPISDAAAVAFARGFYTAIAHGRGVDDATSSGRIAILGAGMGTRSLEWVTPVMYLRGDDSRLFILPAPSPADPAAKIQPGSGAEAVRSDPSAATGWSWETYAAKLDIPPERIQVGRQLVEKIVAAARQRSLPWRVVMNKGYVAIQRPGGYNVLIVDLWWNRVPRLAAKIPAAPGDLGLTSPYPLLPEVWTPDEHEWGWTARPGTPLPDVGDLIDLIRPFHPPYGPMTIASSDALAETASSSPATDTVHAATSSDTALETAIQRLESSGVSGNVRAAAEELLAMGYELRLATTTVPGKSPENYLRIMDPGYTAHGIGYLSPSLFSFTRGSDRERLATLPGAALLSNSVTFSHIRSAQPGLDASRLIKAGAEVPDPEPSAGSDPLMEMVPGPGDAERILAAMRRFDVPADQGLDRIEASRVLREEGCSPRLFGGWVAHGWMARDGDRRYLTDKGRRWIADQSKGPAGPAGRGALNAGTENWRLILEAARALTAAGQTPFGRLNVYQWIWARYPRRDHDRPSLDPTFQGMICNAPGGPPSAGRTPLRRISRGMYELAEAAGSGKAPRT
jgi:CHAT domain